MHGNQCFAVCSQLSYLDLTYILATECKYHCPAVRCDQIVNVGTNYLKVYSAAKCFAKTKPYNDYEI